MELRLERPADQRDLVLFVPDEILVVDHMSDRAVWHRYDFVTQAGDTRDMARAPREDAYAPAPPGDNPPANDHQPGEYPAAVERARDAFRRGDLFEAVLSQQFSESCADPPSAVFDRLRTVNPAPYCALMNLGAGEFLVAASPEMYVRVEGRRVETCPISGTIARGKDALGDAAQIAKLLKLGQGRGRAHHVHRRRPQRQVAHLRAGLGAGDRAPAGGALLAPDPHGGSRGGHPAP